MKGKKVAIAMKEHIKSSAEKVEKEGAAAEEVRREVQSKRSQPPRLKSTFSARNLFSRKDILSQISEFCNELKKLATRKDATTTAAQEEEKKNMMKRISEDNVDGKKKTLNSSKQAMKNGSLVKKYELSVRVDGNEQESKIIKEGIFLPLLSDSLHLPDIMSSRVQKPLREGCFRSWIKEGRRREN